MFVALFIIWVYSHWDIACLGNLIDVTCKTRVSRKNKNELKFVLDICKITFICRIDHNVDDASQNIEAAHTEILKYFQSVTSNRWLMIKIFGVLMVFFIIFIVFMA